MVRHLLHEPGHILRLDFHNYFRAELCGRTTHMNQFLVDYKAKCFIGQPVTKVYKSLLRGGCFAWFRLRSARDNLSTDRFFGNVNCSFNVEHILDSQIFFILVDMCEFTSSSATRIVITRNRNFADGKVLDLRNMNKGNPLYISDDKLYIANSYKGQNGINKHSIHLLIDCTTIEMDELFDKINIHSVDHSRANNRDSQSNQYQSRACLIYNGRDRPVECPSPLSYQATRIILCKLLANPSSIDMLIAQYPQSTTRRCKNKIGRCGNNIIYNNDCIIRETRRNYNESQFEDNNWTFVSRRLDPIPDKWIKAKKNHRDARTRRLIWNSEEEW